MVETAQGCGNRSLRQLLTSWPLSKSRGTEAVFSAVFSMIVIFYPADKLFKTEGKQRKIASEVTESHWFTRPLSPKSRKEDYRESFSDKLSCKDSRISQT